MSQGSSIKQWNTQQETLAPGDENVGLEDLRRGKKGLVTVVVKEEQGAGLGFEGCYEFRERGAFPERERRGAVSKGPERGWGGGFC